MLVLWILLPLSWSYDYNDMHFVNNYCYLRWEAESCYLRDSNSVSRVYFTRYWIVWLLYNCCFVILASFLNLRTSFSMRLVFFSNSPTIVRSLLS